MGSQIAKMGSIIVHTVDYNGVGVLGGHRRIPRKIDPSSSHPRPGSLRVYQIRFRFQIFFYFFAPFQEITTNVTLQQNT